MPVLSLVKLTIARAFNRWALSEINPLHPDLPGLVLRRQELEDHAKALARRLPQARPASPPAALTPVREAEYEPEPPVSIERARMRGG